MTKNVELGTHPDIPLLCDWVGQQSSTRSLSFRGGLGLLRLCIFLCLLSWQGDEVYNCRQEAIRRGSWAGCMACWLGLHWRHEGDGDKLIYSVVVAVSDLIENGNTDIHMLSPVHGRQMQSSAQRMTTRRRCDGSVHQAKSILASPGQVPRIWSETGKRPAHARPRTLGVRHNQTHPVIGVA